jgi:hypothetical protein
MTTIKNRYRIKQKDGDADPEIVTAASEADALNQVARRAGNPTYVAACAAAGLSVAEAMDRITIELIGTETDYIGEMMADDMALAKLLRFGDLAYNSKAVDNYWIFGTEHGERGLEARKARGPIPRWRRDPSAMGDLLERLPMSISRDDEGGQATARIEAEGMLTYATARYAEHPSVGHAIRKAMVQAAIDFLSHAKESRNA